MYEEIGGFSEALPHNHTDVEYSFYVESCGWELGNIQEIVSVYNKTRPGLLARIDETTRAVHPGDAIIAPILDGITHQNLHLCNVCGWHGNTFANFQGKDYCPECSSEPADRSLYRFLTQSTLTFRRLKALAIGLNPVMESVWTKQFQGKCISAESFVRSVLKTPSGRVLDFRERSLDLAYVKGVCCGRAATDLAVFNELARVTAKGSTLLVHQDRDLGSDGALVKLKDVVREVGFEYLGEHLYGSTAVRFGHELLLSFRRI